MTKLIKPGQTIGFLGGGQLGRMMAISAREMGYRIAVLEPSADSPCGQIADIVIEAAYDDVEGAKKLIEASDVVTYEFENVNLDVARLIEEQGYLPQGSLLLYVTQHRAHEKEKITSIGLPVAPYALIYEESDVEKAAEKVGFPSVLKTCRGGYDGKGQEVVKNKEELQQAFQQLSKQGELVLEGWIAFQKEISVIVTRGVSGETSTFPVAENLHQENILHQTIVPARVSKSVEAKATEMALALANGLNLVGTLAVEMFVTENDEIYINELAPRPHNSGHYTIEACETSQFQQHIRAICGWPLGSTSLYKPAVMGNLLGEHIPAIYDEIKNFSDVKLHLYGKEEAKPKRKMGHLTVMSEDLETAIDKVSRLQKQLVLE
ncbi:5-(carboxyamino)imidazole ribonucleotide synthase [Halalkalibacterium ligniniphilum]|uniref:5-(carboxyamino)imidazole ribonucleotide synthase n=1 Tax=Halalkalibacterium ligniniphilum TaxID=1134413 RepID=UPI00034CD1E8|nr:5-(carboxyamino)imidazole ribonucleotide synthase [Halalkalibacterium ligniniphilum]